MCAIVNTTSLYSSSKDGKVTALTNIRPLEKTIIHPNNREGPTVSSSREVVPPIASQTEHKDAKRTPCAKRHENYR